MQESDANPDDQRDSQGPHGSDPGLPDRVNASVSAVERQVKSICDLAAKRDRDDLIQLAQELEQATRNQGSSHISFELRELEEALAEEADISAVSEKLEALVILCRRGHGGNG